MPIDPNIALQGKPVQFDGAGIVNMLQRGQALRMQQEAHAQQMQLGAQQLQTGQQEYKIRDQAIKDDQNSRDFFASNPNATPEEMIAKLGPKVATPIIKTRYEAEEARLKMGKEKSQQFGQIAASITDETSFHQGIEAAAQRGLIDRPTANQFHSEPWNPQTAAQIKQLGDQSMSAVEQHDTAIKDNKEAFDKLMRPFQLEKEQNDARKTGVEADTLQTQKDASFLANAARQGADALINALHELPPARAKAFSGVTGQSKPEDILKLGMTPDQQVTTGQAATNAVETARHDRATEATARLTANTAQARLELLRKKNEMEYGAGTSEFWVHQLQDNPDSIKELPPALRSVVGKGFTAATGLPLPTPLTGQSLTAETAARNALDGAAFIRQALQNPEIQKQIGPIMGRLGTLEQRAGTAVGLSPEAEQLAQELRTRMRYFVFQEGRAVLGGRLPTKLMEALESSSASVKMDGNMLLGALKGAEDNAQSVMDNSDKQRFGGKMRSREMRGQGTAKPAATPEVTSQADYDKLPKGAKYTNHGVLHVKQ